MSRKPTMLFVDAQNLVHGANEYAENVEGTYDIDVLELKSLLADGRDLVRSYWFDSYLPDDQADSAEDTDERYLGSKEGFFYMLQRNGFRVDAGPR